MSKESDTDAQSVLAYWNGREKELQEHYSTVYENEYFRVFRQVIRPLACLLVATLGYIQYIASEMIFPE
ncbi:MAG: hypothetical protein AABZ41_05620 [Bacteroidota bacterium]